MYHFLHDSLADMPPVLLLTGQCKNNATVHNSSSSAFTLLNCHEEGQSVSIKDVVPLISKHFLEDPWNHA